MKKGEPPKALQRWHEFIKTGNHHILDELLAKNVIFHSPVVHTPQKGKEITKIYLLAAVKILGEKDFTYVREIIGVGHFVLEFTKVIDGITINGIDMVEYDKNDQIVDFKVMVRPLKAMSKLHKKMGELLMNFAKKE